MSFWMYRKERDGRRSLYLLDLPWELAFALIGVLFTLLVLLLRRFKVLQ